MLALSALELALRIGGAIEVSMQEHANQQALRRRGAVVVLCIGESTTKGQYPGFLEERLNKSGAGVTFSVINKGVVGTNSSHILHNVEAYLDEYAPSLVVAMMGCNDAQVLYYKDIQETGSFLFRHCRAYRLLRLMWVSLSEKLKSSSMSAQQDDNALVGRGWFYYRSGRLSEAEKAFRKALSINPRNESAYDRLGRLYRTEGRLSEAEKAFRKSLELNPGNTAAYKALGWLYRTRQEHDRAISAFQKIIELDPCNADAFIALGGVYCRQGRFSDAQAVYKKALACQPRDENAYVELTWFYIRRGKPSLARGIFTRAMVLGLGSCRLYKVGAALYEQLQDPATASGYAEKAAQLEVSAFLPVTAQNYRRLKSILDRRRIRLVCVQYPMRSIAPLKKAFEGSAGDVIFVDNEKVFRDAVKRDGYPVYFDDLFAGDFGHCTAEGNRLLADTISRAITAEVFRDSGHR